jgi:hypothetical protein
MRINLLKTAAGLQEIEQLVDRQRPNRMTWEGRKATYAYTRYMPKRAEEIIQSEGSIYWIMKNRILVRQRLLGFEMVDDPQGTWCKIIVDPQLYQTLAQPKKAIQGWRYLEEKDAPRDKGAYIPGQAAEDDPPPEMAEELKKLGLL